MGAHLMVINEMYEKLLAKNIVGAVLKLLAF